MISIFWKASSVVPNLYEFVSLSTKKDILKNVSVFFVDTMKSTEVHWYLDTAVFHCMFKNSLRNNKTSSFMLWRRKKLIQVGTTWGMIFRWTIPLTFDFVHCRRTSTLMRLPVFWWRTSFSTIKVFHMKRAMVTRLTGPTNSACWEQVRLLLVWMLLCVPSSDVERRPRTELNKSPNPTSSQTPATDHA